LGIGCGHPSFCVIFTPGNLLAFSHPLAEENFVTIIIAAIAGGILLLWGGIVGLLRIVDLFERKHILFLGVYTTLVAGCVMGLVLYTNYERQKEHRRQLQNQMDEFSKRLQNLSERLVGQLEEKANLTASEFEIRARLQNEKKHHERTRSELATQLQEYAELEETLSQERQANRRYQSEQNRRLEERFQQEDERYRDFTDVHRRTLQTVQKQLGAIQDDLSRLNTQAAALQSTQNSLLGKVNAAREVQDLTTQKLDALARNQAALYDDLNKTMTEVDSLYTWRKK